jgi:membrane fusion protein, macrolide-specific efflux system
MHRLLLNQGSSIRPVRPIRPVLLSVLALALSVIACTPDRSGSPDRSAPQAAQAAPSTQAPLVGVVAARTSALVSARVDGRVSAVVARSGKRIRAGEPIAELDPALLTDRLRAATAAVDAARADSDGAAAEVAESQRRVALEIRMFRSGATARESVRIAQANLARAEAAANHAAAALREATASRATVESQLSYTHVVAPIDGVVSLVKARVGEVVAPGATIARVFDPANLMIRFQVTRDRRREIVSGAMVELAVAGTERPLRARVTSVSSDLEPPLDFAVAEADIVDAAAARGVQIGTLVEVVGESRQSITR